MTEANDVPDWAIEKALIEPNENSPGSTGSKWTVKEIKEANGTLRYATAVMAFARYIAQHEGNMINHDERPYPPEWATDRAKEIAGLSLYRTSHGQFASIESVAHYIAAHEQPPVDPDLLIAREAVSDAWDKNEYQCLRAVNGNADDCVPVIAALRAIKLYKEWNQ